MNSQTRKVLDQIRPDMLAPEDASWQQRKSSEMRVRILEATIDCLVESGYAALSTNQLTERAGVSRGAMHHHFPNRMALVAATIEYTLYQRLEKFLAGYFKLKKRPGKDIIVLATELYWRSVQTREYAAYLELAVAARTDAELNGYFLPASRKFDRVWSNEMVRAFPEWEHLWDRLQIASDFVSSVHLGLLLNRPVLGEGKRLKNVLAHVARMTLQLHDDMGEAD